MSGSTPGKAGSIMAVWKDGKIEGTVGAVKLNMKS
ncbi:XdhC family protein [Clostridium botulinum]|nr:XdhC family protein [Clostridium botulinum]MCS4525710.1 XdhC family protein [Clostridium botulinum]